MSNFSLAIDRWALKAQINIKTFTKLVAFKVHDRVVERTPVDTGRARASWTIIAGEVPDRTVAPETFSGGAASGISAAKAKQGNVSLANSYVISNNLPYIEALENGHSRQAPVGMATLAVLDVKTRLQVELGAK